MKQFLTTAFCICALQSFSQTITKYFDSNWVTASQERAFYYTNFVKDSDVYHCISYWVGSGKLYATSTYADTIFVKAKGMQVRYYESGKPKDSMLFADNGNLMIQEHYLENGQHEFHAFYDEKEQYMKGEKFDSLGNKLPGYFTYQKQARFPGGAEGWVDYLQTHLKADVPARKKAPAGIYTVTVSFLVDKKGKITEVKAANDPGYGTAEEAIRVIKTGPDWIPAVQNNVPVIFRQLQNISFRVIEESKK